MKKFGIFLGILLTQVCMAQSNLKVRIVENGRTVLEGATVVCTQGEKSVSILTNAGGMASFKITPFNQIRIFASFIGMESVDTMLMPPFSAMINVELKPYRPVLLPVEIKGIRANRMAPFAKTDISLATIERNNSGRDIPFLLNQTPNVVINSDAGNGVGYTGIRIRGTDASRINMTINGIPYNDAESQGLFFVNLPDLLSSVSSIQVQRGVGTSSNGAGAFGATMNFSTHSYQPAAYAEINNTIGSFNTFKHTIKGGSGLIGKHFTLDARISNISSKGFVDRAFSQLSSGQFTGGYWGQKTSLRFNAIIGKEKTYQSWYGISAADRINNRTVNYAGTEKPGEPYKNETDNYWQNHYQFFINHEFKNNWIFNTSLFLTTGRGYYEQYKAEQTLSDYGINPILTDTGIAIQSDLIRQLWLKNKFFGQVFSFQQANKKNEWTIGGGWSRYLGGHTGEVIWTAVSTSTRNRWYDNNANKTDGNLFAKWQYTFNANWRLFTDIQYRYVNYIIDGFRNNPGVKVNKQWHFINPKAGISYNSMNWSGFFSYAMGNKEPNRDDFEAGIKELPRREQLHDFELNLTKKQVMKNLQMGVTMYYMHYKDQLILTGRINDVGAYTRANIPKSFRAGAEFEAHYRYQKGTIKYNGGFSMNRINNFEEYLDDYDNGGQQVIAHGTTNISFSPTAVQFISISYEPINRLSLEWMTKQVSRQFLDNTSSISRSLDGFMATDLRASYTIAGKQWWKQIQFVAECHNVFNAMYEPNGYTFSYVSGGKLNTENFYFPMANRNFMVAVNVKL